MQAFSFLSFFRQLRAKNLFFLALCMAVSVLKHSQATGAKAILDFLPPMGLWLLCGGTLALAASGYVINGLYDAYTDLHNPHKAQVAGRELSRTFLWKTYILVTSLPISLSLLISLKLTFYFLSIAGLLWGYSAWLKGRPFVGNLLVAALCGLVFWQFALWQNPSSWLLWSGSAAFLATLCRELIKDAEDMQADAIAGLQSTAVAWGIPRTRNLAAFLALVLSFLLGGVATFFYSIELLYAVLYATLAIGSMALAWKSTHAEAPKDFQKLSTFWKLYMLLGLGVMAFT